MNIRLSVMVNNHPHTQGRYPMVGLPIGEMEKVELGTFSTTLPIEEVLEDMAGYWYVPCSLGNILIVPTAPLAAYLAAHNTMKEGRPPCIYT